MSQEDIKVEAEVLGANRGGLIVSVGHIRGFMPGSHLAQVGYHTMLVFHLAHCFRLAGQMPWVGSTHAGDRQRVEEGMMHELLTSVQFVCLRSAVTTSAQRPPSMLMFF